jgi:hypothetical protein
MKLMWQRYLIDPLRGRTPLWKVIWIYGFGVTIALLLAEPLFTGSRLLHGLYYAFGTVVGILQSVMLWRCSYNAKSRAYGAFLRIVVVVGILMIPLVLYTLWRHPEIMELIE